MYFGPHGYVYMKCFTVGVFRDKSDVYSFGMYLLDVTFVVPFRIVSVLFFQNDVVLRVVLIFNYKNINIILKTISF